MTLGRGQGGREIEVKRLVIVGDFNAGVLCNHLVVSPSVL